MRKININPEWNDRPAGTFDLHSCIAGFVWCKFWMSIANYLEHFNEQPCSRNFENLLLIFGDIDRGWYFLFVFVESDPWTCIAYKLGFSYVNDILWKIFFDSFLRSDWIQKKKHLAENSIALFLCHHRWFHERIVGQSQDFPENRKRNSVSGKFSRDGVTKTD